MEGGRRRGGRERDRERDREREWNRDREKQRTCLCCHVMPWVKTQNQKMLCPYMSKLWQSIRACLSQGSLIAAAGSAMTHLHIHHAA